MLRKKGEKGYIKNIESKKVEKHKNTDKKTTRFPWSRWSGKVEQQSFILHTNFFLLFCLLGRIARYLHRTEVRVATQELQHRPFGYFDLICFGVVPKHSSVIWSVPLGVTTVYSCVPHPFVLLDFYKVLRLDTAH